MAAPKALSPKRVSPLAAEVSLEAVAGLCTVGTAGETLQRQQKALAGGSGGDKARRAQLARETLDILAAGGYEAPGLGTTVDISGSLCTAVSISTFVPEEGWTSSAARASGSQRLAIEVRCCTVLAAAQDLAMSPDRLAAPGVLNFASARNPGGGFTTGAEAQEESLARSSCIYPCLSKHFSTFFAPHRKAESGLYTHNLIHSPQVPVIRDELGTLLDEPYLADFVTSCAPNCGVLIRKVGAQEAADQCCEALRERMKRVLHTFASSGCVDIVLGAWGCGVFQNDPAMVAGLFKEALAQLPKFRKVIFAVRDPKMALIFADVLGVPCGDAPETGAKDKSEQVAAQDWGESGTQSAGARKQGGYGGKVGGRKQKRWQKLQGQDEG